MTFKQDRGETIAGISVILGLVSGIAGLILALFSFLDRNWAAAGICLVAAALAFGLIANAVFRH